jgi:hypothetical protein
LPPVIGTKRLTVANAPSLPGMSVYERVEAAVQIDVVRDYDAARLEDPPSVVEFEQQISLGVPAVVYEQIDLFELSEDATEAASA